MKGGVGIVFVKSADLLPGMCLARSLNFYNPLTRKAQTLELGSVLDKKSVSAIVSAAVDGAYIDTLRTNVKITSSIDKEIKSEALEGIHSLADKFINNDKGVQKSDIVSLGLTTQKLIDNLATNEDIFVNITDMKMYDDYTYHHSLSVAIMAIAIGLEMGFDNHMLNEIGTAGLLHDIGKMSIPIDIINKPAKLTPEEFELVKQHPVFAAKHLGDRKIVSENIYYAILEHHERVDGTGYPYHLKGDSIHPYARILAVADVYDALTSNRPYRVPSPPNEAIEYIMGGVGSHFDENVVKAFLHKVAPYPTGAHVLLSNGEHGLVLKNFREAPLRPLVSVIGTDRCYDLAGDEGCYNIVVTGIEQNLTDKPTIAS